ncbi:terminase [Candidatus Saccharibacteria bacterium]|nr:terminase [Candidatus Saccharibacteria bacterium]
MATAQDRIRQRARIVSARREFFSYCRLTASDFYKPTRKYLVETCKEMQAFLYSDDDVLVICEPPRHGKSRTAGKFVEWVLGNHKTKKIMTGSYNDKLSTTFSKNVRNNIDERKADENVSIFSDIFPDVKIKYGDAAKDMWSVEGGYNSYLATSPGGTATGFGADLLILDDTIKSAYEAHHEGRKQEIWDWFTDTMLSRLESGGKIIIIMTRWATDDIAGRALEELPKAGYKVRSITFTAEQPDGSMLCDEVLSRADFEKKKATMGEDIVEANYNQKPIDLKGRLYGEFKTYKTLPPQFDYIRSYTDTADEGDDFLVTIVYGVYLDMIYPLDIYVSQENNEHTELPNAEILARNNVNLAIFESNNGGKGFARNVRNKLRKLYPKKRVAVRWFHQSKNKKARIVSEASTVMDKVIMPYNWKERWPVFKEQLYKYQRDGKNEHDDIPDCLTGCVETYKLKGTQVLKLKGGE